MQRCLARITCANLKPTRSTSNSTSLLEALNPNCSEYFILKHSGLGELRTRLVPHPLSFEDPLMYKSHVKAGRVTIGDSFATKLEFKDTLPSSLGVNSTMKFVITWLLMATLGR